MSVGWPDRNVSLAFDIFLFHARYSLFDAHHFMLAFSTSGPFSRFMLAVPVGKCLGHHLDMSATFDIAKLNVTCFFCREAK